MDKGTRRSRERPESQIEVVTESTANMSPPTTFGKSMRLHLDDVRFDDPDALRPDFCSSEAIPRGQAEELIASHTSKLSRFSLPASYLHCSGERSNQLTNQADTHRLENNQDPATTDLQLHDQGEPALDSFLRRVPSSGSDSVRHRSASPSQRKVSIASAPGMGEPRPPLRHRSASPLRRGSSIAASGGIAAASAARDQKVYKAQVAAALNTGRSVWL